MPRTHRPLSPHRLRSSAVLAAACFALVGTPGCERLLSPSQYGQVRVSVATNTGAPVPGVAVTLYTGPRPIEYAHTDSAGIYTFERVFAGNYGVLAAIPRGLGDPAESPYLVQDNLQISPNERRDVAFTMVPCIGSITVTVRDQSGAPAPGVGAILYDPTGTVDVQPTGTDGVRRFDAVPCGDYGIRLQPGSSYAFDVGRGTSFLDGLRVSRTTLAIAVTFSVRATPAATRGALNGAPPLTPSEARASGEPGWRPEG